jgi:hypothetical protein
MKHDDDDAIEDTKGKKDKTSDTSCDDDARKWGAVLVCVAAGATHTRKSRAQQQQQQQPKKEEEKKWPTYAVLGSFLICFPNSTAQGSIFRNIQVLAIFPLAITYTHSMALYNAGCGEPHVCWGKRAAAPQSWPMTDESYMATRHVRLCVLQPRRI